MLLFALAFLLVVVLVAAGAKASGAPGDALQESGLEAAGDDPERYFDGDTIVPVDLEAVAQEEAEREEWLKSPEAEHQRAASWDAYEELSPSASEDLLRTVFAGQLQALNDDPARFLSDAQMIRPLDETTNGTRSPTGPGNTHPTTLSSRAGSAAGKARMPA
jgi:hypothetical protein